MIGAVVLVVALLAVVVVGIVYERTNGAFRATSASVADVDSASTVDRAPGDREIVGAPDVGSPLGERATLLQFSSAFCAPCRATRRVLADVADMTPGVVHVEVDAESHLDLVRRLGVLRTPTVLVLDAGGAVVRRASGLPRQEQVLAALASAIDD